MNLQRRDEIRMMIARPALGSAAEMMRDLHECKEALAETLSHIDTLEQTAAERVIARGAAVKPHTFGEIVNQVRDIASQYAGAEQLRERIAYALAPHFERDGGPTPDYTGEGNAWVPPKPVGTAALVKVHSWQKVLGPVGSTVWVDPQEVLKVAGIPAAPAFGEGGAWVPPVEAPAVVVPEIDCDTWNRIWHESETMIKAMRLVSELYLASARVIPADRVLGEVERNAVESCLKTARSWLNSAATWTSPTDEESALRRAFSRSLEQLDALRTNQGGDAT